MKKVLVILMTLVMVFAVTACGNNEGASSNGEMIDVCIEIDYPDAAGVADVEDYEFQVSEGTTALDMLHAYGEATGIEIIMSDTSATAYVTSIGGVAETMDAGWIYEIDGEMTLETADEYVVKQGTEITWEFMSWADMSY